MANVQEGNNISHAKRDGSIVQIQEKYPNALYGDTDKKYKQTKDSFYYALYKYERIIINNIIESGTLTTKWGKKAMIYVREAVIAKPNN